MSKHHMPADVVTIIGSVATLITKIRTLYESAITARDEPKFGESKVGPT
jgi:hypothetical protein